MTPHPLTPARLAEIKKRAEAGPHRYHCSACDGTGYVLGRGTACHCLNAPGPHEQIYKDVLALLAALDEATKRLAKVRDLAMKLRSVAYAEESAERVGAERSASRHAQRGHDIEDQIKALCDLSPAAAATVLQEARLMVATRDIVVPLIGGGSARLTLPLPLSEENFKHLVDLLWQMRKALIGRRA